MLMTTTPSSLADQAFQCAAEGLVRGGCHGQQSLDYLNGVERDAEDREEPLLLCLTVSSHHHHCLGQSRDVSLV